MYSEMYQELKARKQDKLFKRLTLVLAVIAVLGFALCAYYQIPLINDYATTTR